MNLFSYRDNCAGHDTVGTGLNRAFLMTMLVAPVVSVAAPQVTHESRGENWILLSYSGTTYVPATTWTRDSVYAPKSALAKRLFEIRSRIKSAGGLVPASEIIENLNRLRLGV